MFRALFQPEINGQNASERVKFFAKMLHNLIVSFSLFLSLGLVLTGVFLAIDNEAAWLIWLAIFVSVFIFSLGLAAARVVLSFLFCYGEITERLISIDDKLINKQTNSKKDKISGKQNNEKMAAEKTITKSLAPWKCSFCGCQNSIDDTFCKSCGSENINPFMDSSES